MNLLSRADRKAVHAAGRGYIGPPEVRAQRVWSGVRRKSLGPQFSACPRRARAASATRFAPAAGGTAPSLSSGLPQFTCGASAPASGVKPGPEYGAWPEDTFRRNMLQTAQATQSWDTIIPRGHSHDGNALCSSSVLWIRKKNFWSVLLLKHICRPGTCVLARRFHAATVVLRRK